jgi:hypothetical protein
MTTRCEVYEILDENDCGVGRFKNSQLSNERGEPPFLVCDHSHHTVAEAKACDRFGRATVSRIGPLITPAP